jgi:hypothetical protein
VTVQEHRNCRIYVMAERYRGNWIPQVRVIWKHRDTHRQMDLAVSGRFPTSDSAEEHGLNIGKGWIDEQISKGAIFPNNDDE